MKVLKVLWKILLMLIALGVNLIEAIVIAFVSIGYFLGYLAYRLYGSIRKLVINILLKFNVLSVYRNQ